MATRWGIISAGRISQDFVSALASLPQSEHQLRGIGARDLDKAQDFAKKYGIEKAYGSYEELVGDPEISN
jgi:dihydrodiol dehydrogenase / D-xylose 1-dehydrogenase (NADP)